MLRSPGVLFPAPARSGPVRRPLQHDPVGTDHLARQLRPVQLVAAQEVHPVGGGTQRIGPAAGREHRNEIGACGASRLAARTAGQRSLSPEMIRAASYADRAASSTSPTATLTSVSFSS